MDKKQQVNDILPGQRLPVEIVPVDDAWSEMKKKLDDEMPAVAVAIPVSKKNTRQRRIVRGSLLLLFLLISFLFMNRLNEKKGDSKPTTAKKISPANDTQSGETDPGTKNVHQQENETGSETNSGELSKSGPQQNINRSNRSGAVASTRINKPKANRYDKKNNAGKLGRYKQKDKKRSLSPADEKSRNMSNDLNANDISDKEKRTIEVLNENVVVNDTTMNKEVKKEVGKDSVERLQKEAQITRGYRPTFTAGLQWNFQLPVYGANNYFKGSSARSQPYMLLLPGVWLNFKAEKYLLGAELNPFYSTLLPARPFGTFTTYSNVPDTIVITTETKTLEKTFGIFFATSYHYNISGNWWAGGGMYAYWLRKGIASGKGTEERRSIANGGFVSTSFSKSYVLSKSEWQNFGRFQLGLNAETFYTGKKMQTGFRIGMPINNIAKKQGQKTSLRTEIIFRLPLYFPNRKIKNPFVSHE